MRARTASVSFRDSLVSRAFFSDDAFMYPSPYDVFVSMTQEADNPPSSGVATPAGRAATGPLIVHIPDPRSGEIHLMFGTREVVRRDSALVARLVREAG